MRIGGSKEFYMRAYPEPEAPSPERDLFEGIQEQGSS
jgi:hypothetical protein